MREIRIPVIPWAFALAGLSLPWLPSWLSYGLHGPWLAAYIAAGFAYAAYATWRYPQTDDPA